MIITKDLVLSALKEVIDPELHINIVDLGLIYDVSIQSSDIEITMTLTTPGCPLSMTFEELVTTAIMKIEGVNSVHIQLVWEPPWDPDKISDDMMEEMGIIR